MYTAVSYTIYIYSHIPTHTHIYTIDIGFGVTFFLFRLLAHLYMGLLGYKSGIELNLQLCYLFPLLLHIFWFSSWVSKYGKGRGKKGKGNGKGTTGIEGNVDNKIE